MMTLFLPLLQAAEKTANPNTGFLFMIVIVAGFYLLFIRPQQRKAKKTREQQESLSKGDVVITIGGLHGVVESVNETTITLQCGDSKLEFNKTAIGVINPETNSQAKK